jgi:hypothetical protein
MWLLWMWSAFAQAVDVDALDRCVDEPVACDAEGFPEAVQQVLHNQRCMDFGLECDAVEGQRDGYYRDACRADPSSGACRVHWRLESRPHYGTLAMSCVHDDAEACDAARDLLSLPDGLELLGAATVPTDGRFVLSEDGALEVHERSWDAFSPYWHTSVHNGAPCNTNTFSREQRRSLPAEKRMFGAPFVLDVNVGNAELCKVTDGQITRVTYVDREHPERPELSLRGGRVLLPSNRDMRLRVYDDGEITSPPHWPRDTVFAQFADPDGRFVFAQTAEGPLLLTDEDVVPLALPDEFLDGTIRAGGALVVAQKPNETAVLDSQTGALLYRFARSELAVAVHPTKRVFAQAGGGVAVLVGESGSLEPSLTDVQVISPPTIDHTALNLRIAGVLPQDAALEVRTPLGDLVSTTPFEASMRAFLYSADQGPVYIQVVSETHRSQRQWAPCTLCNRRQQLVMEAVRPVDIVVRLPNGRPARAARVWSQGNIDHGITDRQGRVRLWMAESALTVFHDDGRFEGTWDSGDVVLAPYSQPHQQRRGGERTALLVHDTIPFVLEESESVPGDLASDLTFWSPTAGETHVYSSVSELVGQDGESLAVQRTDRSPSNTPQRQSIADDSELLSPGTWTVWTVTQTGAVAVDVDVRWGMTTLSRHRDLPVVRVNGRVIGEDGWPAGNVEVDSQRLFVDDGVAVLGFKVATRTDAAGRFEFEGMAGDLWIVGASRSNEIGGLSLVTPDTRSDVSVQLREADPVVELPFGLLEGDDGRLVVAPTSGLSPALHEGDELLAVNGVDVGPWRVLPRGSNIIKRLLPSLATPLVVTVRGVDGEPREVRFDDE